MFIDNMLQGYEAVLDRVLHYGKKRKSRGLSHREITGFQLKVLDPSTPLVTGIGRDLNSKIAYVEALQLIAGESYPRLLNRVSNGQFERFMNGEVLHGAYGPRVRPQLRSVVDRLMDHDSRQAMVQVWDPLYDNQARQDLPCTIGFQLLLRDDKLEMVTTMRSNDAWLGLPYDVFQFTQLQATLAAVIGVGLGEYTHNVGSMHVYETDVDKVERVTTRTASIEDEYYGITYTRDWVGLNLYGRLETAMRTANAILSNEVRDLTMAEGLPSKALEAIHA